MDNANNQIRRMIDSIGAVAEMSGVFLKEFLRNGFTREEAVFMISEITTSILSGGNKKKEK